MTPQCARCRYAEQLPDTDLAGYNTSCGYLGATDAPLPGWLKDIIMEMKHFGSASDFTEAEVSAKAKFARYSPPCAAYVERDKP